MPPWLITRVVCTAPRSLGPGFRRTGAANVPRVPTHLEGPRRLVGVAAVEHLVESSDFEVGVSASDRVGVPQLIPLIRDPLVASNSAGAVFAHFLHLTSVFEADLNLSFVIATAGLGCGRDQGCQASAEGEHDRLAQEVH